MKIEKFEKLVANLHDKTEYVIHIRNLKHALNNGFVLKKVHRVIRFSQRRRNYLASETNYRTTILLAIEIKKKKDRDTHE